MLWAFLCCAWVADCATMKDLMSIPPQTELRPPEQVMRLSRMGAMFPTRLSFLRSLMRQLAAEAAEVCRPVWQIDADGHGHAVYGIRLGGHDYSLVAVSNPLADDQRTDRVIATAWDTAYVLYDGIPDAAEIERLCREAPKQEAGRFTERDLVLSRANKSVRLFAYVTECLRAGRQPEMSRILSVGYLMRTTAVYGNGKFGIADRGLIEDRPGLGGPFAAEMLTVWMIRNFTHDLAEHVGGAKLDPAIKRALGIGNSTGLGMAPFLVSHPVLLNNWMMVRETALARVRAVADLDPARRARLIALADRAAGHLAEWQVPDPRHQARIDLLRAEWPRVQTALETCAGPQPLDRVMAATDDLSEACQELTVSLLIEAFGELVDGLAECMADPYGVRAMPFASIDQLRGAVMDTFGWALDIDFEDPEETHQFWYVSEEKLEPRLGARHLEPGAEREGPLDIARRVQALWRALPEGGDGAALAAFRSAHPQHEMALRRVQTAVLHPYSEIRDNLIGVGCLPIDMLRCKLAFFGASKFDPKSDRWTRITLAQGAPLPQDLATDLADDCWMTICSA